MYFIMKSNHSTTYYMFWWLKNELKLEWRQSVCWTVFDHNNGKCIIWYNVYAKKIKIFIVTLNAFIRNAFRIQLGANKYFGTFIPELSILVLTTFSRVVWKFVIYFLLSILLLALNKAFSALIVKQHIF